MRTGWKGCWAAMCENQSGLGLERRQAGQAQVLYASWAGRPTRGKKMRKGKEKQLGRLGWLGEDLRNRPMAG
jgi:hypothetical protein